MASLTASTDQEKALQRVRTAELIVDYTRTISTHFQSIDTDLDRIVMLMREDGHDEGTIKEVVLLRDFLRSYHEKGVVSTLSPWKTYLRARRERLRK